MPPRPPPSLTSGLRGTHMPSRRTSDARVPECATLINTPDVAGEWNRIAWNSPSDVIPLAFRTIEFAKLGNGKYNKIRPIVRSLEYFSCQYQWKQAADHMTTEWVAYLMHYTWAYVLTRSINWRSLIRNNPKIFSSPKSNFSEISLCRKCDRLYNSLVLVVSNSRKIITVLPNFCAFFILRRNKHWLRAQNLSVKYK